MKSFLFEQRSKEWHEWRANGIGSSDITAIMGVNPFKTPLQVWEEKGGFRQQDELNDAMLHGIACEEAARAWMDYNYQLDLKPICVQHEEIDYFRASLDGYDQEKKVVVEIKSPVSEKILEDVRERSLTPSYYQYQLQWSMYITGAEIGYLVVWDWKNTTCIVLEFMADSLLHQKMEQKGKEFWQMVRSGKAPKPEKGDYIVLDDLELKNYLIEYQKLDEQEKSIKEQKKGLKEKITGFGDDGNFTAFGFKIFRKAPSKSYDIDQMRIDGIDVDKYVKVKDSIGSYTILCPRDKED